MGQAEESAGESPGPAGKIAWRRIGSGPPLLLINGYAATGSDWDPAFLDGLAGASSVVLPDNRGMGGSATDGTKLSVEAMAGDAVALLDGLGIESADVAGWSMGGFIAQDLASRFPDRVDRLVLLSTDPGGDLAEPWKAGVEERLFDHSGTPQEQAHRLLGLLFPPALAEDVYEKFGDLVAEAQSQLDHEVLAAQQEAIAAWAGSAAAERLASITAPSLVACGSEDQVIPPGNAALIADQLPDSWLARFPGGGHAVMAQEADRLTRLINLFLNRA